jgi:hypothetical protein
MHALFLPLRPAEAAALRRLAESERRRDRDQAALLLAEALRARGLLPLDGDQATAAVLFQETPNGA